MAEPQDDTEFGDLDDVLDAEGTIATVIVDPKTGESFAILEPGVDPATLTHEKESWVPVRGQLKRSPLLQRLDRYFAAGVRFDPRIQLSLQPIWRLLEGEGLIDTWRARPLCLFCGLPGEMTFTFGGERGVLCLLDGRRLFPNSHLPSPRIFDWVVADVGPRMRSRPGRPDGSSDLPIEELERQLADVFRKHGRRATLARAASEVNVTPRTIQRRLKNERATTFRELRARHLKQPETPGHS